MTERQAVLGIESILVTGQQTALVTEHVLMTGRPAVLVTSRQIILRLDERHPMVAVE